MSTNNATEDSTSANFPLFALLDATNDEETARPATDDQPAEAERTAAPPQTITPSAATDPYADLIKKYVEKAARSKKDDTKYFNEERLRPIAERAERAIREKNYEHLRQFRFRDLNPFSRDIFTLLTGITLPKKQKDCLAVIDEFVGEKVIAAYQAQKTAEQEERDRKSITGRINRRNVRFERRTMTCGEFIDTIIARGFTHLSEVKRGAAPEYRLGDDTGLSYVLRRKVERDYAELRLKQLTPTADTPNR